MKKVYFDRVLSVAALVLFMTVIFLYSSQTATASNSTSGGLIETLARWFCPDFDLLSEARQTEIVSAWQHFVRKTAHFCEYAVFGLLAANAVRSFGAHGVWRFALPVMISVLYAAGDEFHQTFVPGRSGQFSDVVLDSFGAVFGVAFFLSAAWLIKRIKQKRKSKNDTQNNPQ